MSTRGDARLDPQGAEHDPNHPPDLSIHPSWEKGMGPKGIGADGSARTAGYDRDSADDIRQWGIAGRIWEAAYLFRLYLRPASANIEFDPPCPLFLDPEVGEAGEQQPPWGSPRARNSSSRSWHVLELGSGVGYVGISCARELDSYRRSQFGCASAKPGTAGTSREEMDKDLVVLTDLENVVPLMSRNAELAGFKQGSLEEDMAGSDSLSSLPSCVDVRVRALPWGSTLHATTILRQDLSREPHDGCDHTHLDFILCSDLVYFPHLLAPLLRSLVTLTIPSVDDLSDESVDLDVNAGQGKKSQPTVLMAYKIRSYAKEEPFWSALGVWFDVEVVSCRYLWPASPPVVAAQGHGAEGVTRGIAGQAQSGREGVWHRFGSFKADLGSSHLAPHAGADEDQEPSDDAYFIFTARRKPSTWDFEAPSDDQKLMDGYMSATKSKGSTAGKAKEETLTRGQGGADFIEWALMGSMDLS